MKNLFKKIFVPLAIFTMAIGTALSLNDHSEDLGAKAATGDLLSTFNSDAVVTDTGYKQYSNNDWLVTIGGNQKSVGTNSGSASNAKLGNYSYVASFNSSIGASTTFLSAVISKKALSNVGKISLSKSSTGGGAHATTKLFVSFSSTETGNYQLLHTFNTIPTTATAIEFNTIKDANYYAFVFQASSWFRVDDFVANFYEGASATGTINLPNSVERVRLSNSLLLTPVLTGTGTLEVSVEDTSIASVSVDNTEIVINAHKVGTTTLTAKYGGSQAQVEVSVFEPSVVVDNQTAIVKPMDQISITATPTDFTPTSYIWTKIDPDNLLTISGQNTATATFTAGDNLGSVEAIVEASDGIITKTATVTILISNFDGGTYTITTANNTYLDPMDPSALAINKSDVLLGNLVFSNIVDTRLNSSPNLGAITIGANSSSGGKFTITLPAGLYATAVKFNGLKVDSGKKPTLSINNGVKFTFSGSTTETLYPYSNSLEISTVGTSRVWTSSIEITTKMAESAALDFGTYLLNKTDAECANLSVLTATWNELSTTYSAADTAIKDIIQSTAVDNAGNDLEKALGRYEYIRAKYGYSNFILGEASPVIHRDNMNKSNDNMMMISLISIIGLSSLIGYYSLNKKKKLD